MYKVSISVYRLDSESIRLIANAVLKVLSGLLSAGLLPSHMHCVYDTGYSVMLYTVCILQCIQYL